MAAFQGFVTVLWYILNIEEEVTEQTQTRKKLQLMCVLFAALVLISNIIWVNHQHFASFLSIKKVHSCPKPPRNNFHIVILKMNFLKRLNAKSVIIFSF